MEIVQQLLDTLHQMCKSIGIFIQDSMGYKSAQIM